MNDSLTVMLAERVMGWKAAPDRFVKSGRGWISRWRFQPLVKLADAFELLDRAAQAYSLVRDGEIFTAEVRIGSRTGRISGKCASEAITLAVADALEIRVEVSR